MCVFLCIFVRFRHWLAKEIGLVGALRVFGAVSSSLFSKSRGLFCTGHYAVLNTLFDLRYYHWNVCGVWRRICGCLQNWTALWFSSMWRRVSRNIDARVSEEFPASIVRLTWEEGMPNLRTPRRVACYRSGVPRSWEMTEFGTVGSDICGPSVSDLLYVTVWRLEIWGSSVGVW